MRRILFFFVLQFVSTSLVIAETIPPSIPITADNWKSHSDIVNIRKKVHEIDSSKGRKRTRYFSDQEAFPILEDGTITELLTSMDGNYDKPENLKLEIKFMTSGGDADDYYLWTYYFDVNTLSNEPKSIFVHVSHESNFGGLTEKRYYFKNGNLIWAVASRKLMGGEEQISVGDLQSCQFKFTDDQDGLLLDFPSNGPTVADAFLIIGWRVFNNIFVFSEQPAKRLKSAQPGGPADAGTSGPRR